MQQAVFFEISRESLDIKKSLVYNIRCFRFTAVIRELIFPDAVL